MILMLVLNLEDCIIISKNEKEKEYDELYNSTKGKFSWPLGASCYSYVLIDKRLSKEEGNMGYVKGETLKKNNDTNSNIRGFVATVNAPAISDEQAKRAIRQMHEDLKSRRKVRDIAHIKSAENAKNFYSD